MRVALPDPATFDPVFFPGIPVDEPWPPPAFSFQASWLADPAISFERGTGGEIIFVQRFGGMHPASPAYRVAAKSVLCSYGRSCERR